MRNTLRAAGAVLLTSGLLVAGASTASAHVTVSPDTTEAGAYALLTFGIPHGCGESSTTKVSIQIPEQIASVTPTVNPNWDVEKVMAELDEAVDDGHGGQRTERVAEVVYTTDTPLPHDLRDAFELSVRLPDAAGETLVFPAVQECEEGEAAWVQVPAEGQDGHELDMPAPSFEVTAASGGSHEHEASETEDDTASDEGHESEAGEVAALTSGAATPVVTWVALALGAGGLVLGLFALLRTRRTQG